MLITAALSHPGLARDVNEDAVLTDPAIGLVAVADGMGGHNAGEVASRIALESLHAFLQKSANTRDFTWPCGVDFKLSVNGNRLAGAFTIANRRVHRSAEEVPTFTGMGTTLVAALADGPALTFASVGDSRIYHLQGGVLRQLTRDDSWLAMLSLDSTGDLATLRQHPMRNVLTKVVGASHDLEVTIDEVTLVAGDTLLLSTDGLHGAVPQPIIESILADPGDLDQMARRLIDAALERDGSDNVSVVVARATG